MKLLALATALFLGCLSAQAQNAPVSITTRSGDNTRTSSNLHEQVLTPASLANAPLKLHCTMSLPDDARGTEGQPMIVDGVMMPDGKAHDVLYTASMGDTVYAFDSHDCSVLWQQRVGLAVSDTRALDMWLIQDHWGILSTGVIDMATMTYYVVDMTSPTNSEANSQFYLHGLNLVDGHQTFAPFLLNAVQYKNSLGRVSTVGSVPRKQRPGLALTTLGGYTTVFVTMGSFVEDADTNQGWVIAIDMTSGAPKLGGAFATTTHYSGGGIWMGGQAPSIGPDGDLYVMTGNGGFDGVTDFSESMLRLHYDPSGHTIGPAQWFSPFSDTGRVGADQTLADTSLIPAGGYGNEPGGASNMDSPKDEDLGSAGILMLPSTLTGFAKNIAMGAGKDGILYEVDADNMGNNTNASFSPTVIQAQVYAHLLFPPYGFTYYPGNMNLAPTNLASLQTTEFSYTHHQHSTPAYYNSPAYGPMLFTGGENGPVRAFALHSDYSVNYLAQGGDFASANVAPPGGMPGSMLFLSANGKAANTCLLYATQPVGNANTTVTPGYLVVYDCDKFANGNGTSTLVKVWDSRTAGITFMFDKFDPVLEANDAVFVPTYDGRILVLSQ